MEDDFDENLLMALSAGNVDAPKSYSEAISIGNGWQEAIQNELDALEVNNTWELVPAPNDVKIIDSKWVFCEKEIDGKTVKKARLVARGFQQCTLSEDVYAPVARMGTLRVLLSLYIKCNLYLQQLDVKSAFLYGTLKNPVYMYQPEGLGKKEDLVCKVTKFLYGLKEAPKCWNSVSCKQVKVKFQAI